MFIFGETAIITVVHTDSFLYDDRKIKESEFDISVGENTFTVTFIRCSYCAKHDYNHVACDEYAACLSVYLKGKNEPVGKYVRSVTFQMLKFKDNTKFPNPRESYIEEEYNNTEKEVILLQKTSFSFSKSDKELGKSNFITTLKMVWDLKSGYIKKSCFRMRFIIKFKEEKTKNKPSESNNQPSDSDKPKTGVGLGRFHTI